MRHATLLGLVTALALLLPRQACALRPDWESRTAIAPPAKEEVHNPLERINVHATSWEADPAIVMACNVSFLERCG